MFWSEILSWFLGNDAFFPTLSTKHSSHHYLANFDCPNSHTDHSSLKFLLVLFSFQNISNQTTDYFTRKLMWSSWFWVTSQTCLIDCPNTFFCHWNWYDPARNLDRISDLSQNLSCQSLAKSFKPCSNASDCNCTVQWCSKTWSTCMWAWICTQHAGLVFPRKTLGPWDLLPFWIRAVGLKIPS